MEAGGDRIIRAVNSVDQWLTFPLMCRGSEIIRLIRKYNPLGAVRWLLHKLKLLLKSCGPVVTLLTSIENRISRFQMKLDHREFDLSHGTDTGRVIPLANMEVISTNTADGLWYEGISPRIFRQFMVHLAVAPENMTFIDFGSGKGRVLMLAAEHGFQKNVGVEFAREIHEVAIQNAAIFNRGKTNPAEFEFHHLDAVEYLLPLTPLVIFFYCPFLGTVLDQVLANIKTSSERHPRPIYILFYGQNPTAIHQFKSMGFRGREIRLKRDWTRYMHYRGFIFSSPDASM